MRAGLAPGLRCDRDEELSVADAQLCCRMRDSMTDKRSRIAKLDGSKEASCRVAYSQRAPMATQNEHDDLALSLKDQYSQK